MHQSEKNFPEFWREVRKNIFLTHLKVLIHLPIAIFIAIATIRLLRCGGIGADEILKQHECSIVLEPSVLIGSLFQFFPTMMKGIGAAMPFFFGAILYLEWDKYKKDRPHSFGVYGRRTAPNGGWLLSNFERIVSGKAWEKFVDVQLHKISDSETQLRGNFTDQEIITMVKAASKRFTSFLRKPNIETDRCLEWHIHANSGEEVKLRLERSADAADNWILTSSRFDWAGRKNPPTLVETHTTKFVVR